MSSGFISETEILEARRRRQEEWEKVRTEDQPQEAPEEPYDTRPLYQRLEEQRLKKEAEYEEAHKLKNMIRGLDDDEVGFLDLVEMTKAKAAQQISIEEQREMQEFRERVSTLAESEELTRLRAQLAPARPTTANNTAQKNKLQGIIVRKRKASEMEDDKQKGAPSAKTNGVSSNEDNASTASTVVRVSPEGVVGAASSAVGSVGAAVGSVGAMVVAGVLPGLGHYHSDTSTDTDSSDDENDKCCVKRDLLGRRSESDSKRKEDTKS